MASDDHSSPGSPRKKLKLEGISSMDGAIESLLSAPEIVIDTGHNIPSDEHIGPIQEPLGQAIAAQLSHSDTTPMDIATTHEADATPARSNTELSQLEKEQACGITEFVNPNLLGFTGLLKKRYTDFVVNEVLPSGDVVHLTSLRAPKKAHGRDEGKVGKASALPRSTGPIEYTQPLQNPSAQDGKTSTTKDDILVVENVSPATTDGQKEEETLRQEDSQMQEVTSFQEEVQKQEETQNAEGSKVHPSAMAPHLAAQSKPKTSLRSSPKTSPEKESRTRQQFIIRHTENGWVESEKPKKDKDNIRKTAEGTSNVAALEEAFSSDAPKKENVPPNTEATTPAPAIQPQNTHLPEATSVARWQTYADPSGETAPMSKISDEDKAVLLSYFSESVVDAIRSLYNRVLNSQRRSTRDYGTVKSAIIDRALRTRIHQDLRRIFQSRLETTTDKDGAMIISAMPPAANSYNSGSRSGHNDRGQAGGRHDQLGSRGQSGGHGKPKWEELGGEFLHFTLYKENKDTMECISWLSKGLKVPPKSFEFAGTKDRRAITAQRVSVYRQMVGRMIDVGRTLRQANIGDYEYRPHALQLGELTGNEFTITLRDCKFGDPAISTDQAHIIVSEALKNLVDHGFINYYGLQRFGTFTTSTSDIGVKLLQGDFKSAVDAILHYLPESLAASHDPLANNNQISRDDKARAHGIHKFQTTGKAQKALFDIPRKFSAETTIIRHLGSRPNQARDYVGAILSIQRNLRLMYVHAYQSLVWNMATSKRWSTHGPTVIEGDLVLVTEHPSHAPQMNTPEVDSDGEPIIQPAADDRSINPDSLFTRARPLSKEEAASGKYTIFDIVLPTPGFDILYPANDIGKFYEEFMASAAGGGLNPHDMRRPQKDFSLSGSYRKILARPGKEASFEIKTYEDENEQFVTTDLERLNSARNHDPAFHASESKGGKESAAVVAQADGSGESKVAESIEPPTLPDGLPEGEAKAPTANDAVLSPMSEDTSDVGGGGVALDKKIAVILKLQLGSSQYATVALRELMKAEGVRVHKPDFVGGR